MGVRGYGGPLTREGGGRAGPPAVRDENARGARPPRGPAGRRGRLCACAARDHTHLAYDVLLTKKSGSPEDTDLERISLAGPRIKDLGQVVRDREWCSGRDHELSLC